MHDVRTAELLRAIVSKDERVLTAASHKLLQHREHHIPAPPPSPLIPTQVGIQSASGDACNRPAPAALDPDLRRDER
jgi:hypothetical protein